MYLEPDAGADSKYIKLQKDRREWILRQIFPIG